MDSLQDIMGNKNFTPPDEINVIKDYIKRRYNSPSRSIKPIITANKISRAPKNIFIKFNIALTMSCSYYQGSFGGGQRNPAQRQLIVPGC
jgi:hypothetical protein